MSSEELIGRDPDAAEASAAASPEAVYFVLRLGGSLYALDATRLDHVAPAQRPSRVPTAPDHFAGVVHLRGRIVTVLHLEQLLGLPAKATTTSDGTTPLVVVQTQQGPIGIQADALLGLSHVRVDAVRPVSHAGETTGWLVGQFELQGGVATIVDMEALSESLRPDA